MLRSVQEVTIRYLGSVQGLNKVEQREEILHVVLQLRARHE